MMLARSRGAALLRCSLPAPRPRRMRPGSSQRGAAQPAQRRNRPAAEQAVRRRTPRRSSRSGRACSARSGAGSTTRSAASRPAGAVRASVGNIGTQATDAAKGAAGVARMPPPPSRGSRRARSCPAGRIACAPPTAGPIAAAADRGAVPRRRATRSGTSLHVQSEQKCPVWGWICGREAGRQVHHRDLRHQRDVPSTRIRAVNLHRHAAASGRPPAGPVTVGLIGAGKFGTMFLTQAAPHARHASGRPCRSRRGARPQLQLRAADWPRRGVRGALARRRAQDAGDPRDARCRSADRMSRHRGDRRGDRRARGGHPPCPDGDRARQAHRHGQCRGGRGRRTAAGAQGAKEAGRRLQPRLGRPAGADLRARRLGAHLRLQRDRRRQGHALRAVLSPVDARHACGTFSTSICGSTIAARSIRRCSTASSTAPSRASR